MWVYFNVPEKYYLHYMATRKEREKGRRQPALDVQRQPGGVFLVLGDAVAELAGMAEGGTIDAAGPYLQDVDQRQADGAADHRGGAVAVAQRVEAAVRTEFPAYRAVQHDQHGAAAGGGRGAVQQEFRLKHGGEGGDDDGEMHRQAAGHDGVDRQFLRGDRHGAHRLDAEQPVGRHHRPFEAGVHRIGRGRDDRQPVGPAVGVVEFLRRVDVGDVVGAGVATACRCVRCGSPTLCRGPTITASGVARTTPTPSWWAKARHPCLIWGIPRQVEFR